MRFEDFGRFKCNRHGGEDVLSWITTHLVTQNEDNSEWHWCLMVLTGCLAKFVIYFNQDVCGAPFSTWFKGAEFELIIYF